MTYRRPCIVVAVLCCLLAALLASEAGQGWYLLTPPLKDNVSDAAWRRIKQELDKPNPSLDVLTMWWVDLKRPLNEWQKREAFDSARECEKARRSPEYTRKSELVSLVGAPGLAVYRNAVCVAADDPRLK